MGKKSNINLSLLGDRILVKKTKIKEKSSNGIILPDTVKNDSGPFICEVISAVEKYYPTRESTTQIEMPVKVGDRVLVPVFGGVKVNNETLNDPDKNNEYFLFSINDVFAIVTE